MLHFLRCDDIPIVRIEWDLSKSKLYLRRCRKIAFFLFFSLFQTDFIQFRRCVQRDEPAGWKKEIPQSPNWKRQSLDYSRTRQVDVIKAETDQSRAHHYLPLLSINLRQKQNAY